MVGVAVKVTAVPEQIFVDEALTETDGVTLELTVIVTGDETTRTGEAQISEEVISQVMTSPSFNALLE